MSEPKKEVIPLPKGLNKPSDDEPVELQQLAELDPEVTRRLARSLDRLQNARPYQSFSPVEGNYEENIAPYSNRVMTEEERLAHEASVVDELSSLLMIAGQLSHSFEIQTQAQPDPRFKAVLKADILRQAQFLRAKNPPEKS